MTTKAPPTDYSGSIIATASGMYSRLLKLLLLYFVVLFVGGAILAFFKIFLVLTVVGAVLWVLYRVQKKPVTSPPW